MLSSGGRAVVGSIGVAVCLLAVALAVAPPVAADGHTGPPPAAETFEANEDVHVWERSFLTTRADADDAAATVPNADWRVRSPANDETSLQRDPIPVYDPGTEVAIEFDEARADKGGLFGDDTVEVVRARVESSEDDVGAFALPDGIGDLLDDANDNATFASVAETSMDDGELTVRDEPTAPGNYVYVVVTESDEGLAVADGDLSVEDAATVVGVEQVLVRDGTGDVSAPEAVAAGETASFDVASPGVEGDRVTHAVALYDEETYVDQHVLLAATEPFDDEFDLADDTGLETNLGGVNGVTSVDGDLGRFGERLDDGRVTRSAGVPAILDVLAEGTPTDIPGVDSGSVQLDGSVTAVSGPERETDLDVGTVGNWSTGDYRWIYVAAGEDSPGLTVRTDTLRVRQGSDGDGGDGDGGDGDGGDGDGGDEGRSGDDDRDGDAGGEDDEAGDDDDDADAAGAADCAWPPRPNVSVAGDRATGSVPCIRTGEAVSFDLGIGPDNRTDDVAFDRLNVTANETARNVTATVTASASRPDGVETAPPRHRPASYITVDLDASVGAADRSTIDFNVSNETLADHDAEPADVVLARWTNETWEALETTHRGDRQFRAAMPGFSTFAVATRQANLSVVDADLASDEILAGESVEVSATVANEGSREETASVPVTANGSARTTSDVTVAAGADRTKTIVLTVEDAGTYAVAVDGVPAGTLSVTQSDERGLATDTPGGDVGDSGLGSPLLAALAIGLVVAVIAVAVYFRDL